MGEALPEIGEPLTSNIVRYEETANTGIDNTGAKYVIHVALAAAVVSI